MYICIYIYVYTMDVAQLYHLHPETLVDRLG